MLLVFLLLLALTSSVFAAGNETVTPLPAAQPNASSYAQTRTFLQNEIAAIKARESGKGFVHAGGLHNLEAGMVSSAFATEAFTSYGQRVTADSVGGAVAINYALSGCATTDVAWVIISAATGSNLSNFARVGTSNYFVDCVTSFPPLPANAAWLMRVTFTDGSMTAVQDWRTPFSFVNANVYDITDPLYGASSLNVSNTFALDSAARAAGNKSGGVVYVPVGLYNFATKPSEIYGNVMIRCEEMASTQLIRNYTEADARAGFIDMDVTNGYATNAGGGIQDCTLYAAAGTTGGSAINIESSATISQGFIKLSHLYISGAGTWNYGIRMDGQEKSTDPIGVRDVFITDTMVFQSDLVGILMYGVENAQVVNTAIFGAPATAGFIVDGAPGVLSSNNVISLGFCLTAKIGHSGTTNSTVFINPYTVTLTTSSFSENMSILGHVTNIVGTSGSIYPQTFASAAGIKTVGPVLAGLSSAVSQGGKLQTLDGVSFPSTQVDLANTHTLDDYAEGTWTPIVISSGASGTPTYSFQSGHYTKIGDLVHISGYVAYSNHTGASGYLQVAHLPYYAKSDSQYIPIINVKTDALPIGLNKQVVGEIPEGGNAYININMIDLAGTVGCIGTCARVTAPVTSDTITVWVTGTYLAQPGLIVW